MSVWRVIDTGPRRAVENLALNRAMLEARAQNETPSTLRFLQFRPSALLGYHQSAEQELNLEYCQRHGIDIQRRITGGGAIYFDEGQLGWELYLARDEAGSRDMQTIARRICEAAASGISSLGVDARYRPRNDIEVDGRKISGTGGAFDGGALLYQGTLLVEFDVERMLGALRVPAEKLSDKAIVAARERVVSLAELLGVPPPLATVKRAISAALTGAFGARANAGELEPSESERWARALREMDCADWINAVSQPRSDLPIHEAARKFPGGLLRAAVTFDRRTRSIRQVWFTGDMFVSPRRTIADLEAALRDIPLDRCESAIRAFFSRCDPDMLSLSVEDFVTVARAALDVEYRAASASR